MGKRIPTSKRSIIRNLENDIKSRLSKRYNVFVRKDAKITNPGEFRRCYWVRIWPKGMSIWSGWHVVGWDLHSFNKYVSEQIDLING